MRIMKNDMFMSNKQFCAQNSFSHLKVLSAVNKYSRYNYLSILKGFPMIISWSCDTPNFFNPDVNKDTMNLDIEAFFYANTQAIV